MRINTKIRYGLRMLVRLAQAEGVLNTVELGKDIEVSPKYLRKLAGPLENAGVINSIQGVHGGYLLGQDPENISLREIFDAFGEDTSLSRCFSKKKCPLYDDCLVRPLWTYLENIFEKEFRRISLKDILTGKFKEK